MQEDIFENSDKDILDGLPGQGVVDAKRIMLDRDDEKKGTRHVILILDATKLPTA